MAEVVETHDLTAPLQDGWAVDYRIRREDGEDLHAEVRCWEKARAAAERAANAVALAATSIRRRSGIPKTQKPAICGGFLSWAVLGSNQ